MPSVAPFPKAGRVPIRANLLFWASRAGADRPSGVPTQTPKPVQEAVCCPLSLKDFLGLRLYTLRLMPQRLKCDNPMERVGRGVEDLTQMVLRPRVRS
jgi:hypothetical protein